MSTTMTLALPGKAAKAIKPPLKQSEIIHALALRKVNQAIVAKQEYVARLKKLEARIEELIAGIPFVNSQRSHSWDTKHVRSYWEDQPTRRNYGQSIYTRQGVNLQQTRTIQLEDMPADLRKCVKEWNELTNQADKFVVPELREIKARLRDRLTGQNTDAHSRVAALLKDEAVCKALDKTLEQLNKPGLPQIAA